MLHPNDPEGGGSARPKPNPCLAPRELCWRVISIATLTISLIGLDVIDTNALPSWLPLYTSCGAITGLPCIFCGTTRALHHLLHGDLRGALYYNWLAFPFLADALVVIILCALELLLQ